MSQSVMETVKARGAGLKWRGVRSKIHTQLWADWTRRTTAVATRRNAYSWDTHWRRAMEALSQRFSEEEIADYTPAEFLDELLNTDAVPRMTDAEDETFWSPGERRCAIRLCSILVLCGESRARLGRNRDVTVAKHLRSVGMVMRELKEFETRAWLIGAVTGEVKHARELLGFLPQHSELFAEYTKRTAGTEGAERANYLHLLVLTKCTTRAMAKSLAESDDTTHQVAGAALKVRVESVECRQCKSFFVSYGGCTLTNIGDRFKDCITRLKGDMFELAQKLAHELNEPLVEGRIVILSPDTIVRLANKAGVPDDVMVYVAEPILIALFGSTYKMGNMNQAPGGRWKQEPWFVLSAVLHTFVLRMMAKTPGITYLEAQRRARETSALEVVGENEAARGWIELAFEDAKSDAFAVWAKRGDRRLQPTTMEDIKMSDLYTWMSTRCKQQKRELDGLNADLLSVEQIIASGALASPIHRAIVRCQGVRLIERMLTISEDVRQRLSTSKAGFRAAKDVAALDRALTFPGLPAHVGNRAVVQSMRLRRDQVGDRTGDRHSGAICKARADDDVAALDRALTFPGLPAHDGNRAVVQSMRLRREQVGDRTDLGLLHLRVGGKRFGSGGEGISPRISWTDEEVEALREGVAKHGKGKWKVILVEKRHVFQERTTVDLKDKWRNLSRRGDN